MIFINAVSFSYLDGIVLCHLPNGPTAYFKINSLKFRKDIKVYFYKNKK